MQGSEVGGMGLHVSRIIRLQPPKQQVPFRSTSATCEDYSICMFCKYSSSIMPPTRVTRPKGPTCTKCRNHGKPDVPLKKHWLVCPYRDHGMECDKGCALIAARKKNNADMKRVRLGEDCRKRKRSEIAKKGDKNALEDENEALGKRSSPHAMSIQILSVLFSSCLLFDTVVRRIEWRLVGGIVDFIQNWN